MHSQLKKRLPAVAVLAGVTAGLLFVLLAHLHSPILQGPDTTRPSVEKTLASLQALQPASIEDTAFRDAVRQALKAPHVASVWLFAPHGRMVFSEGCMAASTASGNTVRELATDDTRGMLDALPEGTLSEEQRVMVLAASAMRREGEHNDVFRHLVRMVRGPDGVPVALVGVAYAASDRGPGLAWKAAVLGFFLAAAVYWLALPLWVFWDARHRRDRAVAWGVFVVLGNVVALLAYLLAINRPAARQP